MYDFWKDELAPEEEEALIERFVEEIRKRKLETPAILFLESHKPLGGLAAQASIAFSPFLVPFLGFDNVNNYSRLLAKRENIEEMLRRLEKAKDDNDAKEAPCNT
jgi:hypothetical protein